MLFQISKSSVIKKIYLLFINLLFSINIFNYFLKKRIYRRKLCLPWNRIYNVIYQNSNVFSQKLFPARSFIYFENKTLTYVILNNFYLFFTIHFIHVGITIIIKIFYLRFTIILQFFFSLLLISSSHPLRKNFARPEISSTRKLKLPHLSLLNATLKWNLSDKLNFQTWNMEI